MTREAYCERQRRLIKWLARQRGIDEITAGIIWCRNGHALRWAIKHRHKLRDKVVA